MSEVSRILSIAFAGSMCFGLFISFCGIAWLIATPIVVVLRHYFPKLRPYRPEPLYINMHQQRFNVLDGDRTPKEPVKASPYVLEDSGMYSDARLETERFPAAPLPLDAEAGTSSILPLRAPVLSHLGATSGNGSVALPNAPDPIIPIRKRTLIRYLRKMHPNAVQTDNELIDGFLASIRSAKRHRYL